MRGVAAALAIAEGTRARTTKAKALADALREVAASEPARLPFVARFLAGQLLPTEEERTLGVGGSLVFEAVSRVTKTSPTALGAMARRAGDMGSATQTALETGIAGEPSIAERAVTIAEVERLAADLVSGSSRADKLAALVRTLAGASPVEARYIVRAVLGEMRVGAKEGLVEDAIAKAFERPLASVRAAAGLVSDVGELARLAHEDRLAEAEIVLGRPVGFMLATPIETARGADLSVPHSIEDKIDGIRAQAHVWPGGIRLFARGKGAVTTAFPDVAEPLAEAGRSGAVPPAILDGEIVVTTPDGRPRPFSAIQPRLKKTTPDADLIASLPVRYLVYDILFEDGRSLLGLPFSERRERLLAWTARAPEPVVAHASRPLVPGPDRAATQVVLDAEFEAARARGYEGLVLKRLDAVYAAGVRGFSWLKVKKALATLDVVVVAAERGHGRRAGVLSDYTFAVRDGDELKTIGKAYSGLTDAEIAAMTERLVGLALEDEKHGRIPVRPEIVLEVAFDGLQRSDRHTSGFALRFPRIERARDDKTPADADTIETARALWDAQVASGHREEADPAPKKAAGHGNRGRWGHRGKPPPPKQLRLFDDE